MSSRYFSTTDTPSPALPTPNLTPLVPLPLLPKRKSSILVTPIKPRADQEQTPPPSTTPATRPQEQRKKVITKRPPSATKKIPGMTATEEFSEMDDRISMDEAEYDSSTQSYTDSEDQFLSGAQIWDQLELKPTQA